jgi:hypothetical protein
MGGSGAETSDTQACQRRVDRNKAILANVQLDAITSAVVSQRCRDQHAVGQEGNRPSALCGRCFGIRNVRIVVKLNMPEARADVSSEIALIFSIAAHELGNS